jgi:hypothetical protein
VRSTALPALTALAILVAACAQDTEARPPRSNLTLEEAGFLAKGEMFRIYGPDADPVIVEVAAATAILEDRPAWRLDVLADIVVAGRVEPRRWRIWVGLGDDGRPEVFAADETTPNGTDPSAE